MLNISSREFLILWQWLNKRREHAPFLANFWFVQVYCQRQTERERRYRDSEKEEGRKEKGGSKGGREGGQQAGWGGGSTRLRGWSGIRKAERSSYEICSFKRP